MRQLSRTPRHKIATLRRSPRQIWRARALKAGALVLALGLLGAGIDALWKSDFLRERTSALSAQAYRTTAEQGVVVDRIYSEGRRFGNEQALIDALDPYYGMPTLSVDLAKVRERVQGLPWVRSVSVRRKLPDTLYIVIEEYRPMARWENEGRQLLVSETGEVVGVPDIRRFRHLPLLFGKGAPAQSADLLRLVQREPSLAPRVSGARLVGERRWDILLDGGRITVRLPEQDPERAWSRLAKQQRTAPVLGPSVAGIDMRHPEWVTVQLSDEILKSKKGSGA